ncbi:MAG TPA: glycosyltransferase family 4 protein, partial [Coriobacteriia bacterium]|nr:glycosyltransferase family 4 protein [Coriobacteriia bacterium]
MAAHTTRILLIAADTSATCGTVHHVADLLQRLPARGFQVSLICPHHGTLPAFAESRGVPVERAAIGSWLPIASVRAVRSAVDRVRPHVVHAHGAQAALCARLGDPQAARRCIYTLHGIEATPGGPALARLRSGGVDRALRGRTARFVCVCDSDCEKGAALGRLDPAKSITIRNGIEVPAPVEAGGFRAELGIGAKVPLVLTVGQLHPKKDHVTLIEAWARVSVRFPSATLVLIGAGPLESKLRDLANDRSVAHTLRFLAPRPDLRPAYTDADIFVLSSRWTGLPYVVLEAMAHGLPVVATATDGIPEAVTDRTTGLLVPPGDPRTLAEALMWAISEPDKAVRLGATGRARVEAEFGVETMVDNVAAIYREVAGSQADGA